jgi:branched-subunit amino acid aminotransferase/4-amino-4-deoxychorismate lyase
MAWPSISTGDPGFRHGRGVFETLKIMRGKVLFEAEHRHVFSRSAQALQLPEIRWSDLGGAGEGTGIWRWFHTPEKTFSTFEPGDSVLPEAFSLVASSLRLSSTSWEARHKTLAYLLRWQARQEAEAAGFEETALCNEKGILCSASMANLFWTREGKLFTPRVEEGCREGVVRHWVMARLKTAEVSEPPEVLEKAGEIFLTNSRIGIMPVSRWKKRLLSPGPVTSRLREAYAAATA